MNSTSIEWCNRPETRGLSGAKTWNPIRARIKGRDGVLMPSQRDFVRSGTFCTRISPGCTHCYASAINKRFGNGLEYTVPNLEKIEFFVDERILQEPLKAKKPCTIFVGDMFDLFHERIPSEFIAEVLRVAYKLPRHTFQFLTKRADRMQRVVSLLRDAWGTLPDHMWLGVSVEDQQRADERIPLLLQTPAAVRFLSVEPQLEEVDLREIEVRDDEGRYLLRPLTGTAEVLDSNSMDIISDDPDNPRIDWVICGGESGPGARPFNLAWAEFLLTQCRAAGVPYFMKQLGSRPFDGQKEVGHTEEGTLRERLKFADRKGGDPSEWPEALRVREFPTVREAVSA